MASGKRVRRRKAPLRRHSNTAVTLGLGCLLVTGLAGCEYATLEPLPSVTPTPPPPEPTERSPEEQEAFDARLPELTADVEKQLGVPTEDAGYGSGGMRSGSGMSMGTPVTEAGGYLVLTACSPAGQANLRVSPESGARVTAVVPCGERAKTPVQLEQGWVSINLEPIGSGIAYGAVLLLPPGSSPAESGDS